MKEIMKSLIDYGYRPVFNSKYNCILWVKNIDYFRIHDDGFWFGHLEFEVEENKTSTKQKTVAFKYSDNLKTSLQLLTLLESK